MSKNWTEMLKKTYKAVIVGVIVGVLNGCVGIPKMMVNQLEGRYQEEPYIIKSSQSFEKVWVNVVDHFAQKGISISLIDKSSGLIIAKKRFVSTNWTYEENKLPKNSGAYVVVSRCGYVTGYDFKDFNPEYVDGEWNVRIKEQDGKTYININLFNLMAQGKSETINGAFYPNPCIYTVKSTGVFEQGLAKVFSRE
jgi:hypothetical protein